MTLAKSLIQQNEGCKLKVYTCTAGKLTIGWGRNLEQRGLTQAEADLLLENDIKACEQDLSEYSWFKNLNESRQAVVVDMRYQLGAAGFNRFRKMIAALYDHDYETAADEMLESEYALQTPNRAYKNSEIMRTGEA